MLSLLLGCLTLCGQLQLVAAHPKPVRQRSPASIPMHEVYIESDHPLAVRQQDVTLAGGPYYAVDISFAGGTTNVLFDTGSSDLVINSDAVPSSGVVPTTTQCIEAYGGKAAQSGVIEKTTYGFAGFSANHYFCNIQNFTRNGILGFHFPNPNGHGVSAKTHQNPLSRFHAKGLNSFGVYLAISPNGGGVFTPNGWDSSYVGEGVAIMSEPVNDLGSGFWGLSLSGNFEYGGNSYPLGVSTGIVDTGAPFTVVPQAVAKQIWSLTGADPNTGSYGTNCNPGTGPVTFITASGHRLDIPAAVYVIPAGNGRCRSAFKAATSAAQNSRINLGTPIIKAYYTYFDISNKVLNFAQSADNPG